MNTLSEQVRTLVADVLGLSVAQVGEDATQETLGGWDSLGHLNIALSLEAQFAVKLSPAQIERIRSVRLIVDLLEGESTHVRPQPS